MTQKEGELIQEKFEVKKLANFLKQVSSPRSSFELCFFLLMSQMKISLFRELAVLPFLFEGLFYRIKFVPLYLQASEDAKKLVNQEKSFACAEIESARAVVQRFGEALDEQEKNPENSQKTQVYFLPSLPVPDIEIFFWSYF